MHFNVVIDTNGQPTTFHLEPSAVAAHDLSYRVIVERATDALEFRITKNAEGEWHIGKQKLPEWILCCENQLVEAIKEREYPQDV